MYVLKKQSVADIIIEILSAIALMLIIVVPIVSYSSLSALPRRCERRQQRTTLYFGGENVDKDQIIDYGFILICEYKIRSDFGKSQQCDYLDILFYYSTYSYNLCILHW